MIGSGSGGLTVAIGLAAVRLRGRLLSGWSGPPARLAEAVLGLSLLVVVLELVGVVGLYRPGWVLIAAIGAGVGVGVAAGRPLAGGLELARRGGLAPAASIAVILSGVDRG